MNSTIKNTNEEKKVEEQVSFNDAILIEQLIRKKEMTFSKQQRKTLKIKKRKLKIIKSSLTDESCPYGKNHIMYNLEDKFMVVINKEGTVLSWMDKREIDRQTRFIQDKIRRFNLMKKHKKDMKV